ncbi:ARHGB factor, partial [Motacilla alba]|nr:ARHGB factor [Motacilla alba]
VPIIPAIPPVSVCPQDPEVQRHAAQILRNMLRQEEAELQVRPPRWGPVPGKPGTDPGQTRDKPGKNLGRSQKTRDKPGKNLGRSQKTRDKPGKNLGRSQKTQENPGKPGKNLGKSQKTGGSGRPQIIGPEEDCEPGSGSNESDSVFQDLGILKSRPAHLAVFLRFLFSQADPTPLLFHLCCEVCCRQSPRDGRALARDVWSIFLDRAA